MKKIFLLIFLLTISLGQSQTPAAGPPTPPARNSYDVFSQYGSAYSNQPGVSFYDFGGSTIVGDVTLADNSVVKKYINHSYSGISTNGALSLDVSAMTKLHIDVWSPNFVSFKIKLEATNGSNLELEVPFTKTQGSWNSYDLDLSTYTGVDLNHLRYIVPVTFNPNNTTLFITNVYFWRPATIQPPTLGSFTVPAKSISDSDFTITPPTSNSTGAFSYSSSNTAVATIVNGNQIHIVGGGSSNITATQASSGTYGAASVTATFVASYPAPGSSPAPPARAPGDVISMFTGTPPVYANAITAVRAPWSNGATAVTEIPNGPNTCLQVDNMGYLGLITNGANFSALGMSKLHVDMYLNYSIPSIFIFLLSNGDKIKTITGLNAGWNSIDIDLTDYTNQGANLADIYGLKFESNSTMGVQFQMYLDNVYFYVAGNPPTLSAFTLADKVFGDPNFTITPPTSDSSGTFSYSSSNTAVATIVGGNQIHLAGPGTTTITANQATAGSFDSGSISTSLLVLTPPLAVAAPTPPVRNSYDVVSLYSNAYANLPSATWQNASSTTDEVIAGNDTKKMSNFLVEFINFAAVDVSQMTTLHMDIYTSDCTGFNIWLLNNGDRNAQFFPTLNGWYSVNIPLTTYTNAGLIMTAISQLKFEGLNGPGKTVYVDNVYFFRPATLPPATVGSFTVPAKNVGDSNFSLTPPTSNNTSPFTYTSSNTSVATIVSGNQIHIVSGGTSTITASQVSDGTFGPTSRTATFVVSFPAPGPSPIPIARTPSRVISMYTGTPSVYANNPSYVTVRSYWTAATTMTEVPNGTNTALKVDNLGYLGLIDVSERLLNVTGMTNLHLDVYLNAPLNSDPALSRLFVYLLAPGDQFHEEANLVTGWNSLNIDLTQYPGADLTNIYGLKLEQNTSVPTQIYLDNIYFSDDTHYADLDGDGYGNIASPVVGSPAGSVIDATDCDDTRANVHPGAFDVCYDGLDNDCDGIIDNGCTPITTVIATAQCGITLPSINAPVYANVVSGAQGYRFRVTNLSTGLVQSIDRFLRVFNITSLPVYAFATTYQVEVSVKIGGVWQPFYGTACTVSTPATTTKVQASQCGSSITSMNDVIYADLVPFAQGYRFRVTNIITAAQQIFNRSLRDFRMNLLTAPEYNATYTIEVAVKNTDGTYLPYGPLCNITTPNFPTTQLQASQCDYTASSTSEIIYADSFTNATVYRFKMVNAITGYSYVLDRATRTMSLSLFPGLTPSTTYSVQVSMKIDGVFGPYGKVCSVTTPGSARATETGISNSITEFKAIAYPNPFAANFKLELNTTSDAIVSIKVYDMLGKQIENKTLEVFETRTFEIGNDYPTGVYNVIVNQGENSQIMRVIKR